MNISGKRLFRILYSPEFLFIFGLFSPSTDLFGQTKVHIVLRGEDLFQIARKYDLTPKSIARVNKFDSVNQKLFQYEYLIIPEKYYEIGKSKDRSIQMIKHRIREGESLYSISRIYGTTVYDILLRNHQIKRGEALIEGQYLLIFSTPDRRSQVSEQLIFLNSGKIDFDTVKIWDSSEYEWVKTLNDRLHMRIQEIYENSRPRAPITDTLNYPSNDNSDISRMLFDLVKHIDDTRYPTVSGLDSLLNEVLYPPNKLKRIHQKINHGWMKRAIRLIRLYSEAQPDKDQWLGIRALLYFYMRDYSKAEIFCEEALYFNPKNTAALFTLASIHLETSNYQKAVEEYKMLFETHKTSQLILYNLATAYYKSLQSAEAIQFYSYIDDPNLQPEANYRIGHCYLLLNEIQTACEYIQESVRLGYTKAQTMRNRYCR